MKYYATKWRLIYTKLLRPPLLNHLDLHLIILTGLGGHCIPIDPFYLTWKAKEFELRTRFIELAGEINNSMPNLCSSED